MYADTEFLLEKTPHVTTSTRILHITKTNKHMVCSYSNSHTVHLTATKTNIICTEAKAQWKGYLQTEESTPQKQSTLRKRKWYVWTKKQEKNTKNKNSATYGNKNSVTCLIRMKIIVGSEITVIALENIETPHEVSVT